jgi:hypothetical protein
MPSTYTFGDAVTLIRRAIPPLNEDDYAAEACNMAVRKIWTAYDWRETMAKLPSFNPIPGEQDHGAPAVAVPADFMGIREAYLMQLTDPTPRVIRLNYLRDLAVTTVKGVTTNIGFHEASNSFRLFPRVPDNIGSPDWVITGTYKKLPEKLTPSSFSATNIPWDDLHYQRFCEVLRWAAWSLVGDQRAGEVQHSKGGGVGYSGARAKAEVAILEMAENEGLEMGDPFISPQSGLVSGIWGDGYGSRW